MFTRLTRRRLARGLLAALLFTLLHPLLAIGLAKPVGSGDGVQVCTGFGMVWLRAEGTATAPRTDVSPSVTGNESGSAPATGGAPTAAPQCPLCAGAAMAAPGAAAEGQSVPWPVVPHPVPPEPLSLAPCSARLILDAPTRGPPRTARLA